MEAIFYSIFFSFNLLCFVLFPKNYCQSKLFSIYYVFSSLPNDYPIRRSYFQSILIFLSKNDYASINYDFLPFRKNDDSI